MARNRKRAKERRARRPAPVATARADRDEVPGPTRHAAPDVELAEAQMALGRPELAIDQEPDAERAQDELELEQEAEEPIGSAAESAGALTHGEATDGAAAAHPAQQRPGPLARLRTFLQGSWRELQRVQWPDRRQVIQATGVVLGFVIVAGVYLGIADQLAAKLVNFVLK